MEVTLCFEIDNAQVAIAADIGLDAKGRVIARSQRNCANRIWAKNYLDDLNDSGMAMQRILKNQLDSVNEESNESSPIGNKGDESCIDTDSVKKVSEDNSDTYQNSIIENVLNNIYGKYNNCEELVKRIQNSLKDSEGNINKHTDDTLNGILSELRHLHADVNILKENFLNLEDYIVDFCYDEDDEEEDDDELDEYLDSEDEESDENSETLADSPVIHDATLKYINGIYYTHNFYKYQTKMSVDKIHWVICDNENIPKEYKDFINQKYMIDIRTFISGFSYWINMVDPINTETKLPVHITITYKLLSKIFEMVYDLSSKTIGYLQIRMSKPELINYIHSIIFNNPETQAYFKVLNTSYNDAQKLRNGEEPNSSNIVFCSRYSTPHWMDDFIDLDALTRNVVEFIIKNSAYSITT